MQRPSRRLCTGKTMRQRRGARSAGALGHWSLMLKSQRQLLTRSTKAPLSTLRPRRLLSAAKRSARSSAGSPRPDTTRSLLSFLRLRMGSRINRSGRERSLGRSAGRGRRVASARHRRSTQTTASAAATRHADRRSREEGRPSRSRVSRRRPAATSCHSTAKDPDICAAP